MQKNQIIHCMYAEKFIAPYLRFLEKNFDLSSHFFLIRKDKNYPIQEKNNILFLKNGENKIYRIFIYMKYLNDEHIEKIILHGILNKELWCILFIQPWLLKKCYWVIWGGDLYYNLNRAKNLKSAIVEKIMGSVIKKIGFIITYVKNDFLLAKLKYQTKAKFLNCLIYESNIFDSNIKNTERNGRFINILLGNSAHASNQHLKVIEYLSSYRKKNIRIYCPLSYGSESYAKEVARAGKDKFGHKFIPLFNFMGNSEYIKLLSKIDIGIFPANRQQGMGNLIPLLGLGKKIYLDKNLTSYAEFSRLKIRIFDIDDINLKKISAKEKKKNMLIIKNIFSETNLIKQWKSIFNTFAGPPTVGHKK